MISNCRELFDLPADVTYLNCAYTAPLLRAAAAAGEKAVRQKSRPWAICASDFFSALEVNRERFAALIGAPADDIAVVPAASYGVALAARNIPVQKGRKIVLLQDQFPSNLNSWVRLAHRRGADVVTVRRPSDADWTAALLEAIDSTTAVVAAPHCHWTDGTLVDLVRIGEQCRRVGAALVVDGTQSIGALSFSVKDVRPDLLVAAAHKWLLGPYSYGFCYVAPKWQGGEPLEENWLNRAGSEDFSKLTHPQHAYRAGARRYDVGEASNFILAPIATAALDQLLEWGVTEIAETLRAVTDRIAERMAAIGFTAAPPRLRASHMIGLYAPGPLPPDLPARLAAQKVYVSVRGDAIRVAPHLYTTEGDIERLAAAVGKSLDG